MGGNFADVAVAHRNMPQNFYIRLLDLERRLRKTTDVVCRSKAVPERSQAAPISVISTPRLSSWRGFSAATPTYVDALQLLGDHYTQRGRYLDGLKVDERLARLEPRNALVFYNLACSYSLTNQFERAAFALEKALNLGYRDFTWLAKDPDLRKLRQQPVYRDIQAKIRRMKIKVC